MKNNYKEIFRDVYNFLMCNASEVVTVLKDTKIDEKSAGEGNRYPWEYDDWLYELAENNCSICEKHNSRLCNELLAAVMMEINRLICECKTSSLTDNKRRQDNANKERNQR